MGAVAVELEAVSLWVAEVQCFGNPVVRCAFKIRPRLVKAKEKPAERGPVRHQKGEVVKPQRGVGP